MMLYNFINSKFFVNFMLVTIIISIIGIFLLTFESISVRYGTSFLHFMRQCNYSFKEKIQMSL